MPDPAPAPKPARRSSPQYIDTNILVRVLTGEPAAMTEAAVRLIGEHRPVCLASAVLLETAFVLQGPYHQGRPVVADALAAAIASPDFIADEPEVWRAALATFAVQPQLHLVDCYMAARAAAEGGVLHTFDQDLARFIGRRPDR